MPNRDDLDKLIIGSFCSIGTGASFMMAGNQGHRMDWISTFPFFYTGDPEFKTAIDGYQPAGDTVIGHDVWIGSEAMILPGIHIGSGAIIGARAVITKDVEPYAIMTGVPAKMPRLRFNESDIRQLLEMAWWNWPIERLSQVQSILCSDSIEKLYAFWLTWK